RFGAGIPVLIPASFRGGRSGRESRAALAFACAVPRLPVVAVQMPPAPSERDFYEELLVSMGCVLPIHQSVTTLRQRTRVTARQLEVRMLVIDEIHFHSAWNIP